MQLAVAPARADPVPFPPVPRRPNSLEPVPDLPPLDPLHLVRTSLGDPPPVSLRPRHLDRLFLQPPLPQRLPPPPPVLPCLRPRRRARVWIGRGESSEGEERNGRDGGRSLVAIGRGVGAGGTDDGGSQG